MAQFITIKHFCHGLCAKISRCFPNIKGLTCTMPLTNRCYYCPFLHAWGIEVLKSTTAQLCKAFAWREELGLSHPSAARGLNAARGKLWYPRPAECLQLTLSYIQICFGRQTCNLRGTGGKVVINSSLIGIAVSNSA